MNIKRSIFKSLCSKYMSSARAYSQQNPATKTWKVLTQGLPKYLGGSNDTKVYPEHADIVIIGGGFIGSAAAYALKIRAIHGLEIVVIEKNISFTQLPQNLSLGILSQHYSLPENIQLSQFSAEFFRNIKYHFSAEADIKYSPNGSLVLASEKYANKMEETMTTLKEYGIKVQLLTAEEVKEKYPWINTSDVKYGCISSESEGLFNPLALHNEYLKKNASLGIKYVKAEVTGFEFESVQDVLMEGITPGSYKKINKVVYTTPDGEEHSIKFAVCVLAAGDQSGNVAKLARIGVGDGLLEVPLPVTKKEYNVYALKVKSLQRGLCTPLMTDTSGLWLKKYPLENQITFGMTSTFMEDSKEINKEDYYQNIILPSIQNRLPTCNINDIKCLTTEMHDCNTYDNTGVLGLHPYYNNLIIATGFGKQGCQHAPGIGRAVAELIIDSRFTTIDFTRFGYDRFITAQPLVEFNIY